ncbi:NAD(P)/FAD-dependent oxidoreductase [Salinisphaera orenii]|uniref:NAD(P)/FAD-dependent oxidoreductase n=1 Tax=Salinisphaera orenii TaxID=856731 RepID=UPI000DBE031F
MSEVTESQVAVVGGGIVGTAVACVLQRRGYRVTLIDGAEAPERASYGNAGFLATELIDPLATMSSVRAAPGMWWRSDQPLSIPPAYLPRLAPWLWRFVRAAGDRQAAAGRRALSALNQQSVAAWQRLLAEFELDAMLQRCGYLMTWESQTGRAAAQRHAAHLRQWDIECELLDQAGVRHHEPGLTPNVSHALYFPNAYRVVDPQAILDALQAAFVACGGRWRQCRVTGLTSEADHVRCQMSDGEQAFDRVVVCAGAWSHELLRPLSGRIPLETERGYHLTFGAGAPALRHAVGSVERRVVLNGLSSGLRIVGFTELGGLERPPTPRHFDVLAVQAKALLADGDRLGEEEPAFWMGFRPSLPDSLPVIDQLAAHPRVFCAFGHQHLGVTQAAITAELIAARMVGERPEIDLTQYSLSRFQ